MNLADRFREGICAIVNERPGPSIKLFGGNHPRPFASLLGIAGLFCGFVGLVPQPSVLADIYNYPGRAMV
jgi:hypothetical protein